jgi:hypothetical protein
MCFSAPSRSVNFPVDSMTTRTPSFFHGSSEGSFAAKTLISFPATTSPSPRTSTASSNRPCTESYFRVLQEVGKRFRVGDVVYGNDVQRGVLVCRAEEKTSDPSKPVDPDFYGHISSSR